VQNKTTSLDIAVAAIGAAIIFVITAQVESISRIDVNHLVKL
jgi:hypothetical protein